MSNLNDLVTKARRRALSDIREETDILGAAVNAGATSLSLAPGQTLGSIQSGVILEIEYELYYVVSATNIGNITVIPGYLDTTSLPHPANAQITVNPRFPNSDIVAAINEDIDALSSPSNGLFAMKEVTLTYNPVIVGYDLAGLVTQDVLEIYEVRAHDYGPAQVWPLLPPRSYKLQRNADPSIFPSGMALELYSPGFAGRHLRVQYKAPFDTPLLNAADDVETVTGLHSQAHDIPVLGAIMRLMQYREIKRSFTETQTDPRRAEEVPVGASLTAIKGITAQHQMRIQEEASRLQAIWPRQWR